MDNFETFLIFINKEEKILFNKTRSSLKILIIESPKNSTNSKNLFKYCIVIYMGGVNANIYEKSEQSIIYDIN